MHDLKISVYSYFGTWRRYYTPVFISETNSSRTFPFSRLLFFRSLFPFGDNVTNLEEKQKMEIHNPNRLDWISGTRNSGILIEFVLKVYIFTDDMILYIENPKEYAKNYQS